MLKFQLKELMNKQAKLLETAQKMAGDDKFKEQKMGKYSNMMQGLM